MTVADPTTGGGAAPGAPTSLERIEWIVALEDYPVRRNLLITQTYHELSDALAHAVCSANANWCTFATWASRCAGKFVRDDEVPARFRARLGELAPVRVALARTEAALVRVDADATVRAHGLLELMRDVVQRVSTLVTAGNLAVFGELAPVFSRALDAFAADDARAALDPLVDSLEPGLTERGGQSLLQSALLQYAAARDEADPHRRAARMLLANAQIGLHEQIRLQPFIAGSIDAPIREAIYEAVEHVGRDAPTHVRRELHAVLSRCLHPIADAGERLWEEVMTHFVMTLPLPSGTVMLGRRLHPPPGAPLYPAVLDPIVEAEVEEFLLHYGAHDAHSGAHGAANWASLGDRMRFILDLFRSRQCDATLLTAPFSVEQRDALYAGRPVAGPLG